MGAQRQPFQVLFCGQRRGSACGRQGCTAGTSVAVSVPGEQRGQRFPRRSAGGGAGKAPAASRSAGGTLIPTIKHPHGQAETSALLFFSQQFSARCALARLPVLLYGEADTGAAQKRLCGLAAHAVQKAENFGMVRRGKPEKTRCFRDSGAPAPPNRHACAERPCAPLSGLSVPGGYFSGCAGRRAERRRRRLWRAQRTKNRLHRAHTPQPVFCWFLWDSCSRFPAHRSRRFLSVCSRFVLCPVGRTALPARYESRPAAAAVLSWLP